MTFLNANRREHSIGYRRAKCEDCAFANREVVGSGPSTLLTGRRATECLRCFGGPEGIRTLDLFHAMEARSQLRHRPTWG